MIMTTMGVLMVSVVVTVVSVMICVIRSMVTMLIGSVWVLVTVVSHTVVPVVAVTTMEGYPRGRSVVETSVVATVHV